MPSDPSSSNDAGQDVPNRTRRTGPQVLADELLAEELIAGAPSRNGGRLLTDNPLVDVWSHNAWDKVEWDEEQEQLARAAVERQMSAAVPLDLQEEYNADPASFWDSFYANVKDGFFNDRAWLRTEFHELDAAIQPNAGPKRIVEIGCGPGNTFFPLFTVNKNPEAMFHGYDFSKEAVEMVKNNSLFNPAHCTTGVWDLASKDGLPSSLEEGSVDIAIMIFVLSALHPDEWEQAVKNAWTMLKPGGLLLFRDYGRNDMAQLRFKGNRFMQPGLYVRGDHTRVYFFERDELVQMFGGTKSTSTTPPPLDSLSLEDTASTSTPPTTAPTIATTATSPTPLISPYRFELLQLGVDRRLLLNRKKMLRMYRVWLQGRWRKPVVDN